jgi:hypothetical protein
MMKTVGRRLLTLAAVLVASVVGCSDGDEQRVVLPEDPCSLVRPGDVAAAFDTEVTKAERVPSIDEIVSAQNKGGADAEVPRADQRLCSYTTTSEFGAVTVFVPAPSAHGAKLFTSRRDNAKEVDSVGDEAYFEGGSSLSVLVDDEMFSMQVQRPVGEDTQPALVELAERAVDLLND